MICYGQNLTKASQDGQRTIADYRWSTRHLMFPSKTRYGPNSNSSSSSGWPFIESALPVTRHFFFIMAASSYHLAVLIDISPNSCSIASSSPGSPLFYHLHIKSFPKISLSSSYWCVNDKDHQFIVPCDRNQSPDRTRVD